MTSVWQRAGQGAGMRTNSHKPEFTGKREWRNTKHGEEDGRFPHRYKYVCCSLRGLLAAYPSRSFAYGVPGAGSISKSGWVNAFPSSWTSPQPLGWVLQIQPSLCNVRWRLHQNFGEQRWQLPTCLEVSFLINI